MARTWWQKSPLTSSTRPLARLSGSAACQLKSCATNGRMQAAVLPEPVAPKTAVPVKRPAAGTVSHVGRSTSTGSTGWCCSPMTMAGSASRPLSGHLGSVPRTATGPPRGPHTSQADRAKEPATPTPAAGQAQPHSQNAQYSAGS